MSSPMETRIRPRRSLAGQVAVVTGAGAQGEGMGNGRAIALLLAEDGASVVCVDRDLSLAERTVQMIQGFGRGLAIACRAEIQMPHECEAAVHLAVDTFGRIDILVNNVGIIGASGTALDVNPQEWTMTMEINVTSMMLMAKYAIPVMMKNTPDEQQGGIRGSIVNLGSITALQGGWPSLAYPTSKGVVMNMTRAMAAHHGAQGIKVNCVCLGMVYTPLVATAGEGMTPEMREATIEKRTS